MTDFTLSSGNYCRPYWTPFPPERQMKLSTGMSSNIMYIGAVVGLDVNSTAFRDCIVPSSMTSNTIVSTAIVGIAAMRPDDPSNKGLGITSTTPGANGPGFVPVWEANPVFEFRAHTRNGLLNSTIVGEAKELLWDSTLNILLVNVGASCVSNVGAPVVVTRLLDNVGDSGGAVVFRFMSKDVRSSLSTTRFLAFFP